MIDQTSKEILSVVKFLWCMFIIVEIKLKLSLRIKDIPAT